MQFLLFPNQTCFCLSWSSLQPCSSWSHASQAAHICCTMHIQSFFFPSLSSYELHNLIEPTISPQYFLCGHPLQSGYLSRYVMSFPPIILLRWRWWWVVFIPPIHTQCHNQRLYNLQLLPLSSHPDYLGMSQSQTMKAYSHMSHISHQGICQH